MENEMGKWDLDKRQFAVQRPDGTWEKRIRQSPLYHAGDTSIRNLQGDVHYWHQLAWGKESKSRTAMKLGEETGEVIGACIKVAEGRREVKDIEAEVGDLIIVACSLASAYHFDVQRAMINRFYDNVQYRQHPTKGKVPWAKSR